MAKLGVRGQRPCDRDRGSCNHFAQFRHYLALASFILGGCTATANPWKLESIATGIESFDSARLIYSAADSPLRYEILVVDGGVETFLSLTRYKFTPKEAVKVEISIGGEKSEELVSLLEGKMRLRFPPETTERVVLALQEGSEVAIIVDGFEGRLSPESFNSQFEKILNASIQNPFKGLF